MIHPIGGAHRRESGEWCLEQIGSVSGVVVDVDYVPAGYNGPSPHRADAAVWLGASGGDAWMVSRLSATQARAIAALLNTAADLVDATPPITIAQYASLGTVL